MEENEDQKIESPAIEEMEKREKKRERKRKKRMSVSGKEVFKLKELKDEQTKNLSKNEENEE